MEFVVEETEIKTGHDHVPPKYRTPVNGDWKLSSNVECRVTLERLNICSPEQEKGRNFYENAPLDETSGMKFMYLIDQLSDSLRKCDKECNLCDQYVQQLSQHIYQAHGVGRVDPACNFKSGQIKINSTTSKSIPNTNQYTNSESELNNQHEISDSAELLASLNMKRHRKPPRIIPQHLNHFFTLQDNIKLEPMDIEDVDDPPQLTPTVTSMNSEDNLNFPENGVVDSSNVDQGVLNLESSEGGRNDEQTHINDNTPLNPYKCEICKDRFPNRTSLDIHKYIVHVEEKSRDKREDRLHNIIATMLNGEDVAERTRTLPSTHTGEKVTTALENKRYIENFKCKMCGHSFTAMNELAKHEMFEHVDRDKQICTIANKCAECGEVFLSLYNLRVHVRSHTGEKLYKCESCEQSFLSNRDLDRHKLIHTGEKPFKCVLCGNMYATCSILNLHKRTHTREKKYKCDRCEEFFTTYAKLRYHKSNYKCLQEKSMQKINREHLIKYKCITCRKMFPTMYSLNRHRLKLQHIGVTSFKCDVCHVYFTAFYDFRLHNGTMHGQ